MVAFAPSRVELLGNHTDYNGGLVLAAAINRFTVVVGRPVANLEARVVAVNFAGEQDRFDFENLASNQEKPDGWRRYVRGVTWAMQQRFPPIHKGFEIAIAGNVPLGAGLSSSASLQAALAVFLRDSGAICLPRAAGCLDTDDQLRFQLAQTLQLSENEYVGVGSGLLDQFSVLFGQANYALMLDCRTLEYERLPMGDPAPAIVVCDSKTSRSLADGMYNVRREECERVVRHFEKARPLLPIHQLRDITLEDVEQDWPQLDVVGRLRARHVLSENERVRKGAIALKSGDTEAFGRLMSESHKSSRDDFQNSSPALDALVEAAEESPGFLGGKLSGAGWAGCTVNLVQAGRAEEFSESVRAGYARKTGIDPIIHVCRAANGASAIILE